MAAAEMAKTIREAYGEALAEYGRGNPDVVVLDADVSSSTRSALFQAACPERFFNVGVAEANMAGMAAGFASVGKIPFVNTFATFVSTLGLLPARIFGSYSGLNVKFVGAYGGLSDAYDGPSHHSVEDLAIMRALPNFRVYAASDEVLTKWLVKHAIESKGPMYVRLSREAFPPVYEPGTLFEDGRGKVLRKGGDAVVVACGLMVGFALEAAKELASEGIEVTVVDMFTIKPLDAELLLESARSTGAVVTAEEHSVIGGLGGAVAEALAVAGQTCVPVGFVGLADCHAECGSYAELLRKYRLDVPAIVAKVRETVAKKR
ncbi:MAG: transketolase family protein [Synergistaceae bacterium]|jgi:transketolase|nr:transketolase family protein [Synergistaceae bacterium]